MLVVLITEVCCVGSPYCQCSVTNAKGGMAVSFRDLLCVLLEAFHATCTMPNLRSRSSPRKEIPGVFVCTSSLGAATFVPCMVRQLKRRP